MNRFAELLIALVLTLGLTHTALAADKLYSGEPIKVLLVTGGGFHDFTAQAKIVPELIRARGDFTVEVIGPNWEQTKKKLAEADWAKGYDIVVYNICDAKMADKAFIHNIAKVHTEGTTPAVIIHGALHSFHWNVGKDRKKYEGEEWVKVMGIASANHGPRAAITITTVKKDHPIMKGLPKQWKTPQGELYNSHEVLKTAVPLAMGDNGNKQQGPQVCVWINQCEKSKVFGTSIGHHNETMKADPYGDLLVRGLLWACDRLKAD